MGSNTCKTSEFSRVTKIIDRLFDGKDRYFLKNLMELLRRSGYYQPCFINNPLMTEEHLKSLMYNDGSQQVDEHQSSWVRKRLVDVYNLNDWRNDMELLLWGSVNFQGKEALSLETKDGLFVSGEQCNDPVFMLTKANCLPVGLTSIQDSCHSDQFRFILEGARCKGKLSCPGYYISPAEDINPGNINQGQGGNDNVPENVEPQDANNDQNDPGDLGPAANAADGDGGDAGDNNDENQEIVIYRYEFNGQDLRINLEEVIPTNVIANDCQILNELAHKIRTLWQQRHEGDHYLPAQNVTLTNCWPRAETIIGWRGDGRFQSLSWTNINNFMGYKRFLNCLLVIGNMNGFAENGFVHADSEREDDNNVVHESKFIKTALYHFGHERMQINLVDLFGVEIRDGNLGNWFNVAREFHMIYLAYYGLENNQIVQEQNIANCWGASDNIFGCLIHNRFQSLNWHSHEWRDVRQQINFAIFIKYEYF